MALKPFWSFPPYFIASFSQNDSVSFSLTAAAPKFCFAITRSDDIWWRRRFAFFLPTPSKLKMALKNLFWNGSGSFFDIYFLKWVLSTIFWKTMLIGNFTDQNQFEQNDSDVFTRHLLFWHSCTFFFDRHWWCCVKNAPIFNQNLSSYNIDRFPQKCVGTLMHCNISWSKVCFELFPSILGCRSWLCVGMQLAIKITNVKNFSKCRNMKVLTKKMIHRKQNVKVLLYVEEENVAY